MKRVVTLFTGQWADLSLEEMCKTAKEMGYEGLELATWGQICCKKAASDEEYVQEIKDTLKKYDLRCEALGAHLSGQCVGDLWDPRLDGFVPTELAGKPEAIRAWAMEEMKDTARAAKALGCTVVTGFMGSAGSHLTFGDMKRGWNFVSLGHGDVDFDKIIRVLNEANYDGPLSVEWEDSGMNRIFGATEDCQYVKKINFSSSTVAFDDAIKN